MRGGRAEQQGRKENIVILKTFKVPQSEDRTNFCVAREGNSQFSVSTCLKLFEQGTL